MKTVNAILILTATFVCFGSSSNAQFAEDQRWVPDGANMLTLIRSSDIFNSEIGKQQKWREQRQSAFEAGISGVPPFAERLLLASQMDLELMKRNWQVAVVESRSSMDLVEISTRVGGTLDTLDNDQSLLLPTDAFLIKVEDKKLVAIAPAHRQTAVRWIRQSKRSPQRLSEYLSSTLKSADETADILIALDLEHFNTPDGVQKMLKGSEIIADAEIEQVSQLISEMQGVTLSIKVKDKATGVMSFDFPGNPDLLTVRAKALLISALEATGLMIDDFEEWQSSANDRQIVLSGAFTPAGLRQLFMIIQQPLPSEVHDESEQTVDPATKTIQYFKTIESLVAEVRNKLPRRPTRSTRSPAREMARAFERTAKWYDQYARQIDDLPVLGVDQDVLDYGQYVSDGLRDITSIAVAQSDQISNSVLYNSYYRGGYYRGYRRYYGGISRARAGGQATEMSGKTAVESIQTIDSRTAEMRRALIKKYGVEF